MKVLNKQDGQVLLYALLVISFITAIAITISIIVVNELRLTTMATDATVAFYGAESGVERGLYTVRVTRESGTETVGTARDRIRSQNDTLDSSATYDNSGTDMASSFIEHETVQENQYVQADYYNAIDPLADSTVRSVEILNEGDNPASWAEVSWIAWDENGQIGPSENTRIAIGPSDLEPNPITGRGWIIPRLDVFSTISPVGYRMRVKAFKAVPSSSETGDLSDLSVIPFDAENGQGNRVTDLPSEIAVNSVGQVSSFKQSITATVPWKVPLAGLYDYVLYSEGEIVKDIVLNRQTYSSGALEMSVGLTAAGPQCPLETTSCATCMANGWQGWCPDGTVNIACWAEDGAPGQFYDGTCEIRPQSYWGEVSTSNWQNYGFIAPIPDTVPEGNGYYVSLRIGYQCGDGGGPLPDPIVETLCKGRDIEVEVNGVAVVIDDLAVGEMDSSTEVEWVSCTIPDTFSLGDPALSADDPSRTIRVTNHPYGQIQNPFPYSGTGWMEGTSDLVVIDFYQVTTAPLFPDCY
ncbi:MAG: hypothetical protein PHY34_02935 [Patescibacteria group bacterium]|nr:hypothetical protein [Patescibacteria group bacterium]MDD5715414.1 hypothetical protein [Patescibacteria group bacterium]